jgi:hypothetical protein
MVAITQGQPTSIQCGLTLCNAGVYELSILCQHARERTPVFILTCPRFLYQPKLEILRAR